MSKPYGFDSVAPFAKTWAPMLGIPEWNHFTSFQAEWWNARRRRDYYVHPFTGGVCVVKGSPSSDAACGKLREEATRIVLDALPTDIQHG